MSKLTETQAIILTRASQQPDRIALPLPDRLRGSAANKVIVPLIQKGFLDEVEADLRKGEPTWRKTGDGHGTTLVITDAGLEAIGGETVPPSPAQSADYIGDVDKKVPRTGSKQAILVEMLRSPTGATLASITSTLGWQKHTARGAMSNLHKRYPALSVTSEKPEGSPKRIYRIVE